MSQQYADEFPLLRAYGLYAANILGDGNCLFNALSDQMYGSQAKHHQIRARVIDYMRENSDFFKQFMTCYPGGGLRRNPKRKSAGVASTSFDAAMPSAEEIERTFEGHLSRMAKGGTWGDNMEIVAFSSAFDVNVKIYQRDNAYMVAASGNESQKLICHIAYHEWEHYSSIRNIDGPHDGMPHIKGFLISPDALHQTQTQTHAHQPSDIPQWKIDTVSKSLAYPIDQQSVIKMLEQCNGNVNNAVDKFLEVDEQRSISSQQSSSADREFDSSDDPPNASNKKQDRRLSRATKATLKLKHDRRKLQIASKLDTFGDSLDSLVNITSSPFLPARRKRNSIVTDSDDEDSIFEPLKDGDTSSESEYSQSTSVPALPTSTASQPSTTGIKLKLTSKTIAVNSSPPKRLVPAREARANKKLAQKAAAKQRKQAMVTSRNAQLVIDPPKPSLATGIVGLKTLYI